MFERYTEKARRVIFFARYEASQFGSPYIETEHLLLGLLRVEDSLAARALGLLAVTHGKVRRRVVRLVDVGAARPQGSLPFTPRVRELIEDAFTGAVWTQRLGESLVGTAFRPSRETPWGTPVSVEAPRLSQSRVEVRSEDLLLALIAHGEGVAAHVLGELAVDLEKAAVAVQSVRFPRPEGHSLGAAVEAPTQWPPAPPKQN
jgi:ATP-dependent Clp protease ATP-binding subunit ClpC